MKPAALVIFIALAIAPSEAAAQPPTGTDELRIALLDLQTTLSSPSIEVGRARPRLTAAITWLINNHPRTNPADLSVEYVRSIQQAAELLKIEPSPDVVEDVTSELEAKVDHCRKLGIGMGGSVLLRVDTRRVGAPVENWQVLYLLKIYERVPGAVPGNFPRLSTPTERPVEPGRYWIWARDPSTGQVSDRSLVTVAGQKELLVDIAVP